MKQKTQNCLRYKQETGRILSNTVIKMYDFLPFLSLSFYLCLHNLLINEQ